MKTAYELAMERLAKAAPAVKLTACLLYTSDAADE